MATITVRGDLRLGGVVLFDTAGIPKKVRNPRVEVRARQGTCPDGYVCPADGDGFLTYAATFKAATAGGALDADTGEQGVLLGGGGSAWLAQGGPAHCTANLYYLDNSGPAQQFVVLATCSFEAAG